MINTFQISIVLPVVWPLVMGFMCWILISSSLGKYTSLFKRNSLLTQKWSVLKDGKCSWSVFFFVGVIQMVRIWIVPSYSIKTVYLILQVMFLPWFLYTWIYQWTLWYFKKICNLCLLSLFLNFCLAWLEAN